MNLWVQSVQATVQLFHELLTHPWRHVEDWRQHSALLPEQFHQTVSYVESFAMRPILQEVQLPVHREAQLAFANGVRNELAVLLSILEPQQAMAVLCRLPSAAALGYSWDNLVAATGGDSAQVLAWERDAYRQMQLSLSERTPFFAYLLQKVPSELERDPELDCQTEELLLQAARHNPQFDLRLHVAPALELAIRQAYHRAGVDEREQVMSRFAESERLAVELVGARMMLEVGGEEEAENE